MISLDLDLSLIPVGAVIRDIEDGDCYFEGVWQGGGKYKVTRVLWNDEECLTSEEDEVIGTIIPLKWYWIEVFDSNNAKILGT